MTTLIFFMAAGITLAAPFSIPTPPDVASGDVHIFYKGHTFNADNPKAHYDVIIKIPDGKNLEGPICVWVGDGLCPVPMEPDKVDAPKEPAP